MAVKTQRAASQELAATKTRTFRNFLLMAQFEAREIGQRIAEARTIAGLTQEQLAELSSFSKRSLQDYEAGITIPYRHMREISRLLGREVDWFLTGGENPAGDRLERLEGQVLTALEHLTESVEALSVRVDQLADQAARPSAVRKSRRGAG